MTTTVRRDPFAREELERRSVTQCCCAWCGQRRRALFVYRGASDGGRKGEWSRPFCNLDCYDSYTS